MSSKLSEKLNTIPYQAVPSINQNEDYDEKDPESPDFVEPEEPALLRDLIGFFICGLINNYGYVVMLSAALDMLDGTSMPASAVLLADILPGFLIQATAPWWMSLIHYRLRILFIVVAQVASFLLPALVNNIWVKLTGVMFASLASGFGEITFLALSGFYNKKCVVAFSSGTGGAGIAGSLTYLGLRAFLSPKISLLVCFPIPLAILFAYFVLISKPNEHKEPVIMKPDEDQDAKSELSLKQQAMLWIKLLPYMVPLFMVYFGEYVINQSVDPVMTFHNSPHPFMSKGAQYRTYQFLYQFGVFFSRSSAEIFPIRQLWIPALLQIINMIFLSFQAVFHFIPYIWIIFVIIFWEGLLGGSIYVNAFYLISQKFSGAQKEFCLGATSMSYGLSITIAAGFGIWYQGALSGWRHDWLRQD